MWLLITIEISVLHWKKLTCKLAKHVQSVWKAIAYITDTENVLETLVKWSMGLTSAILIVQRINTCTEKKILETKTSVTRGVKLPSNY